MKTKVTILTLVLSGAFLMAYMLSPTDMDETKVAQKSNHTIIGDKETTSYSQSMIKVDNEIKPVASAKEKQADTKLAPHHLYVRSSTQIEQERIKRDEIQKLSSQMKKNREDHMRKLRRQQERNKHIGREDV